MTTKTLSELMAEAGEDATRIGVGEQPAPSMSDVAIMNPDTDTDDEVFFTVKDDNTVEIDMDKLRECKIFFATPCYGGQITDQYFLSMFKTSQLLMQHGIDFRITTLRNESLIPRGRNILQAMYLYDDSMTHLMFIDADIEWEPDSIIRMLSMNKDIVVGAYPKKTIDWNSVKVAAKMGEETLEDFQAEYALNLKFDIAEDGAKRVVAKHGAIELLDASTGFFLVKRRVFDKFIASYPELKYNNDSGIDPKYNDYCYAFFDTMIDPDDRRYLSEDYTFCRRAQDLGIRVWLDPNTNLNHVGTYTFKGNIGRLFSIATDSSEAQEIT
jgi:hypothetical protein